MEKTLSWRKADEEDGDDDKYQEYEVKSVDDLTMSASMGRRLTSYYRQSFLRNKIMRKFSSSDFLNPIGSFYITTDSKEYQCWWLFMVIVSLYSSMFTPLEFGFYRGLPRTLWIVDLCVQFIFVADIMVKFNTAYKDRKTYRVIADHRSIALRYIKSDFIIDLLGCLPWDTIYKSFGRKEEARFLVWIRLYRVRKCDSFFVRLEKDIRINYFAARIAKLLAVEFYCTHTAACIYYYLATTVRASREGYTWIGSLTLGDFAYTDFRQIDLGKRYVTSLYWAILTMATVGYGDIHAVNPREMVFVMAFVSFDMILGAYLLGNMTALIVKGSSTEMFRDRMTALIKYMNRNQLPRHIRKLMKRHVRLQFDTGTLNEDDVLGTLPVSIRAAVAQSLYSDIVEKVPLFRDCSSEFLNEIVSRVVEEHFLPGEVIVQQGGASDQMYIVWQGCLEEQLLHEDGKIEVVDVLQGNSVFGEVGVLCNIPQPFSVRVIELSRVLRLDKQTLTDIVEIYFNDGRLLINNLLEWKNADARVGQIAADVTFLVAKQNAEMALMVNNASFQGDLTQLKHLVKQGAAVARADYDGRTALHLAASKGYENVALYLIREGADINAIDKFGISPLLECVRGGHDHCMSVLQDQGAVLHLEDAGGYLCKVVTDGHAELLRRLLTAGADPNASDYDKRTALHLASAEGKIGLAKLLLDFNADPGCQDRWGRTALDEALLHQRAPLVPLLREAAYKRKHEKHETNNDQAKPAPRSKKPSLTLEGSTEADCRNNDGDSVERNRPSIDYASSPRSCDSFSGSPRRANLVANILDRESSSGRPADRIPGGGRASSRSFSIASPRGFSVDNENAAHKYRHLPVRQGGRPPLQQTGFAPPAQVRRRVTIFPYHPWTPSKERTGGKVDWVPPSIEEILDVASTYFGKKGVKVLNQDGGDFTSTDFIMDGEKIYVVDESEVI